MSDWNFAKHGTFRGNPRKETVIYFWMDYKIIKVRAFNPEDQM